MGFSKNDTGWKKPAFTWWRLKTPYESAGSSSSSSKKKGGKGDTTKTDAGKDVVCKHRQGGHKDKFVGIWTGEKDELYEVWSEGKLAWSCVRNGAKVFTIYSEGNGFYWWGTTKKFFLDEKDLYSAGDSVSWYTRADYTKTKPAFTWWKLHDTNGQSAEKASQEKQ